MVRNGEWDGSDEAVGRRHRMVGGVRDGGKDAGWSVPDMKREDGSAR